MSSELLLLPPAGASKGAASYTLYMWGSNDYGSIGNNQSTYRDTPVTVESSGGWTKLVGPGGQSNNFFLGLKGTSLYAWGNNGVGQFGNSTTVSNYSSPVQIPGSWSDVSTNGYTILAIKTDGTLWAWGENWAGMVGDNSTSNRSSPVQIGTATNWTKVNMGTYFNAYAIKSDNTLWGWGYGSFYGSLGFNDLQSKSSPTQISGSWSAVYGGMTSFGIKTDNTLWGWGYGSEGGLGNGNGSSGYYVATPIQIGTATDWKEARGDGYGTSLAIKTNGTLWATGANAYGNLGLNDTLNKSSWTQVGSLTNWSKIISISLYVPSAVLKTDGTLWAWGDGTSTGFGDSSFVLRSSPVQVGSNTYTSVYLGLYLGLKTDGNVTSWGNLPFIFTTAITSSPIMIGSTKEWISVASGAQYTVGIKTDGSLWAWGKNRYGQLGTNDLIYRSSPVQVGTSKDWTKVSCGVEFTVAMKKDGSLWTWGRNFYGELGDNTRIDRSSPIQIASAVVWKQVATGTNHVIAQKVDGVLWAWGAGSRFGGNASALGDGGNGVNLGVNRSSPVQVLTSKSDWTQIAAGGAHSFALDASGNLYGWGLSQWGQLYPGISGSSGYDTLSPNPISSPTKFKYVACGWSHTAAITTGDELRMWGDNYAGTLGNNSTSPRYDSSVLGTGYSKVLFNNNSTFALKPNGTLWAWGANGNGQLGLGDLNNKSSPVQVGALATWAGSIDDLAIYTDDNGGGTTAGALSK